MLNFLILILWKVDANEKSWNNLLDYSCYRKLLYNLNIITEILKQEDSDQTIANK